MSIINNSEWPLKALSMILIFIITGCVSNKAFRTEIDLCNSGKCENAVIETNAQYDLAFVE
ncbi:MAG: hypothetical protein KGN35_06355, partial [Betaproteobacteria bacterium]|nr:hypothetical protein [Betaproteobacteria bacterium]